MRIALVVLLVLHGLIHLLGFVTPWKLAKVQALSGPALVPLSEAAARGVGVLWLLAAAGFLIAAVLRLAQPALWWPVAAFTVLVSQALIILQWHDAKAGTVANVLIAAAVLVSGASQAFRSDGDAMALGLLRAGTASAATVVEARELDALPSPVRRWLLRSGVVGKPRARTVRLQQRAVMVSRPGGAGFPVRATQVFSVDPPGFVWSMEGTMVKVLPVVGRDSLVQGRGRMFVKVGGLVTVADGTGLNFDSGAAVRYLCELVMFPSAALSSAITWEPIDDSSARATLRTEAVQVSAVFAFDSLGRFSTATAQRSYAGADALQTWRIPATAWKTVRGVEIPVAGGVVWKLASGDFDYFQWEVLDVETNPALLGTDTATPDVGPHAERARLPL